MTLFFYIFDKELNIKVDKYIILGYNKRKKGAYRFKGGLSEFA